MSDEEKFLCEFRAFEEEIVKFETNLTKDRIEKRKDKNNTERRIKRLDTYRIGFLDLKSRFNNKSFSSNFICKISVYAEKIEQFIKKCNDILEERKKKQDRENLQLQFNDGDLLLNSPNVELGQFFIDSVENSSNPDNIVNFLPINMANFDFKTAASLLPKLNSSDSESVYNLIEGIQLYEPSLNQIGKPLLINYILKACISHKDSIRMKKSYDNTVELISDLKKQFLPRQSSTALAAKLQSTTQGEMDIEKYGRKIEELMSQLTIAQTGDNDNALPIFQTENEKIAVDVFARGIRNTELRTIVKAGRYRTLNEAINAAKDEVFISKQTSTMYHMQRGISNNFQANKFRGTNNRSHNNNFRGNMNNRYNTNSSGRYNNNSNNHYYSRKYNYQGSRPARSRNNYFRNSRNYRGVNRPVYTAVERESTSVAGGMNEPNSSQTQTFFRASPANN